MTLITPISTPVPAEPPSNPPPQNNGMGITVVTSDATRLYSIVESRNTFLITAFIVGALATAALNSLLR